MLLRGQNLLGYKHYADDVVDEFVKRSIDNGIDIIRIFPVPFFDKYPVPPFTLSRLCGIMLPVQKKNGSCIAEYTKGTVT